MARKKKHPEHVNHERWLVSYADFITLLVKTNPEAGHHGISIILFPTNTPGFSVSKKLSKMGNWASDTAELFFDNCRVPKRYLLGQEGMGFIYLMQELPWERMQIAIGAVAGAAAALEWTLAYMRTAMAGMRVRFKAAEDGFDWLAVRRKG